MVLAKRVVFITGATDGLGYALTERRGVAGDRLILHGRDAARLNRFADHVEDAAGNRSATVVADFALLLQVETVGTRIANLTDRLVVLVSNAGTGPRESDGRSRRESADGFELRFAVNYLAGFRLALDLLLLLLRASAPSRAIYVASRAKHPLDFDDPMIARDYSGRIAI